MNGEAGGAGAEAEDVVGTGAGAADGVTDAAARWEPGVIEPSQAPRPVSRPGREYSDEATSVGVRAFRSLGFPDAPPKSVAIAEPCNWANWTAGELR